MLQIRLLGLMLVIATTGTLAQVNPLGLFVDVDGKVKFWESEPNYNGQVDDTVYITTNKERNIEDLRNLRYNYLTFVEAPGDEWIIPSNLDPSKLNDTLQTALDATQYGLGVHSLGYDHFTNTFFIQQSPNITSDSGIQDIPKANYEDESRGANLNDSLLRLVQQKLILYKNRNCEKPLDSQELELLQKEISSCDTVIDGKAVFDYLVDLFIDYTYDTRNRLTQVIGYHWSHPLEIDTFIYDQAGNISYFSREQIGIRRTEISFKYDTSSKVVFVAEHYCHIDSDPNSEIKYSSNTYFSYNSKGVMDSKTVIQDGNHLHFRFELKEGLLKQ